MKHFLVWGLLLREMNVFITLSLILTVLLELKAVPRGIRCKYDEFKVQDVVGNLSCVSCMKCPVGLGLSPQCGSYIPYGNRIECKPCVSGETYSSTNSIESCQPCGICVDHQKVLQKCNTTHNSICAKKCDVGFYLSSIVGDCQECSWCCPNSDPSEHEPQCKKDGVPSYKHCSVQESIRCSPRCTNQQYVIVTKTLNQSCHKCPPCGIGRGRYPKCQSVLTSMKESKCQTCIPGKTFSDATDSSSCKPCKVCGVGKKVERSCNITHDTLCGVCDHGFYNSSLESNDKELNCKHCSYCCGDDKDIIIHECTAQGMPKNMQCKYTTRALTKCAPAPVNKALWISLAAVGFLLIVVASGVTYKCANKNKSGYYTKMETGESQNQPMQDCLYKRERPSWESTPNNIEFRHLGVIVQCPDTQTGEVLLKEMSVEICWEMHRFLPYQEDFFYLSPLIQFHSGPHELQTAITLDIPHSAYQQEENNTWKIKVFKVPIREESTHLELIELSDDTEVKVNPCSVRFTVKELAAYVVVGETEDPKHAKKRMQCAVFGATPIVGQIYSTRIYLLDDAESSLEKLEWHEKSEGRHRLKNLFCALHPDVDKKSTIGVAIEVIDGWKAELSKKDIKCCEWIDSYKRIPEIEVYFKHTKPEIKDFQCIFKLNFEDQVAMLPVFHYAEPEHTKTGIQPFELQQTTSDDTPIGISESRISLNELRDLSSVPSEVLTTFCNSLEQSIGEDPTRIESFATKIIPFITAEEVISIKESDQPFRSLIDMASEKEITLEEVQQVLKKEGLNPDELMPFLHKENSTPMV